MGRTLVSITQQLAQAEERLGRYRRALTVADRQLFDDLFAAARRRLAASSMAADPQPMQIILLGMLIGTAAAVTRLAERVEALERLTCTPPGGAGTPPGGAAASAPHTDLPEPQDDGHSLPPRMDS